MYVPWGKMSCLQRFQTVGVKTVLLKRFVSIYAMKMLERNITAVFVLISVPWVYCTDSALH